MWFSLSLKEIGHPLILIYIPAGSPSRGGDVTVYVFDINQPSSPTPLYSVLLSVSLFMALSIVFRSINYPGSSPFSHSVLPVLSLPYWSFRLYFSLEQSPHMGSESQRDCRALQPVSGEKGIPLAAVCWVNTSLRPGLLLDGVDPTQSIGWSC